jgi:hypothetical protein
MLICRRFCIALQSIDFTIGSSPEDGFLQPTPQRGLDFTLYVNIHFTFWQKQNNISLSTDVLWSASESSGDGCEQIVCILTGILVQTCNHERHRSHHWIHHSTGQEAHCSWPASSPRGARGLAPMGALLQPHDYCITGF